MSSINARTNLFISQKYLILTSKRIVSIEKLQLFTISALVRFSKGVNEATRLSISLVNNSIFH